MEFFCFLQSELFRIDMQLVDKPLLHHVALITSAEQKNFFDLLHFSPLKVCILEFILTKLII